MEGWCKLGKNAGSGGGFSGWGGAATGSGTGGPARGGTFQKGHTGIPRNSSPEKEAQRQRNAEHAEKMRQILLDIAGDTNNNPNARVSAATALLNRIEGMPTATQVVEARVETSATSDPASVEDRLKALLARARAAEDEGVEDDGAVH